MSYTFARHTEHKTFEAFDLRLDTQSQAEFDADPHGFIQKLIAAERTAPSNRVIISSDMLSSRPIRVLHQIAPPAEASDYLIINTKEQ